MHSSFSNAGTTAEPVSLQEAKDHLRISISDDDQALMTMISAARQRCELETKTVIASAQCSFIYDQWPCDEPLKLTRRGVSSVTSITYLDQNGTLQTLSPSAYRVDLPSYRIVPVQSWPQTTRYGAITVTVTAGYAPACAKQAILLIVGSLYKNREADAEKQNYPLPTGVDYLLAPLQWGSYLN